MAKSPRNPGNPISSFFSGRRATPEEPAPPLAAPALPQAVLDVIDKPLSHFEALARASEGARGEPATHVAFVLDESGSMEAGKETTIEGFNRQVEVVREGAKEAGHTTFTDVRFSSAVRVKCVAADLSRIPELDAHNYRPNGCTALYDALGLTIARLLEVEGIHDAQTATLVTLFTDGEENHSTLFDARVLGELVRRLEASGRWTFALVGPSGTVSALAGLLSVKKDNVREYDPASPQSRKQAFEGVTAASASYMKLRSQGIRQSSKLHKPEDPAA